jgi:hypothetical protein
MSSHAKTAPWAHRSALHIIAAPVARLLRRQPREKETPYDWREIERLRIELELKKAHAAIVTRFKIM